MQWIWKNLLFDTIRFILKWLMSNEKNKKQ